MNSKTNHSGIIIWGLLSNELNLINSIESELNSNYDSTILKSSTILFNYTNYYEREMGKELKRLWIVTKKVIDLSSIADVKLFSTKLEKKFQMNAQRRINIDPGFLTLSNLILATTKNYSHRIYLKDGIFAEVTLIFHNNSFQTLEWTYPDYRDNIEFFNNARKMYQQLLNDKS